jgi:hypothetical protein
MFSSASAWWSYVTLSLQRDERTAPWRDQYAMLRAFYLNNGVYETLGHLFREFGADQKELKELRNPAFRVVEFYASKLWPGKLPDALPLETENDAILEPIEQIWEWSNWGVEKQICARWFAMYGDMFLKISTNADMEEETEASRVFIQNLDPRFVTEFDADERGFLTYARLDIPMTRRRDDKSESYTHTEIWDKRSGTYRLWEHKRGIDADLATLGQPGVDEPLSAFGIDFVPIVWAQFRPIGEERGSGAFSPQITKIDEVNRLATRLHQMMFRWNKPTWALEANAIDGSGRPLPPPRIGDGLGEEIELDDDTMVKLPGMSKLASLVPNLDYKAHLDTINAQMAELQADLPELAYSHLRERDLSGRAIKNLLGDAVDRLLEARGNAETAMTRAHQMGLTVGVVNGLFEQSIGTFENGDFDHSFGKRDPFPPSLEERATATKMLTDAGFPLRFAARYMELSDEEMVQLEADLLAEQAQRMNFGAALLDQAEREFNAGNLNGTPEEVVA